MSGEPYLGIEGNRMHVDTADHIAVATESTYPTDPLPALGLLSMQTFRALAGGSPLRASETMNARFPCLHFQILDILPILPV